ncbi:MAG: trigger factor [Anaerolineae bacterium]|nr:trigger factor [Anaerolineae bacterium]
MNIQTERLENHTARLTVELEATAFEQAKQKAARKLSNRVNLPGFRKGKAPYHIVVRFIGEPAIVEEAVELMSSDLYPAALKEANIEPYGPGSVEDIQADPLAIVYVVPLAATVDLKDYRSIRLPFEPPVVTDKDVEHGIRHVLEREAETQPTDEPAVMGNRVTIGIHSHLHEAGQEGHEGEGFIHEHGYKFVLDEHNDLVPGFSAKLTGAKAGDKLDFELTIPEDSEDFEEARGKTAHFEVEVSAVELITLPELNDAFADLIINGGGEDSDDDLDEDLEADGAAAELAEAEAAVEEADDGTPATVAQLRVKVRDDIERGMTNDLREKYADDMLKAIVEQADIRYPEALIADQIESMLSRMDQQLRQQGLNLEDYKRLLHKTDEDLFNDYRDPAIDTIRHSLARREFFDAEQLAITDADMDAEFDRLAGDNTDEEQRAAVRSLFENQGLGDYLREQVAERKVSDRLFAIGTGEAPELTSPEVPETGATTESEEETA